MLLDKCKEALYDVRTITNLRDMIEQSEKIFRDKPAFLVKRGKQPEYQPITYKQFKKDIESFGTALVDLGLQGKRIAIIGESRYEWAVSYLAVVNGTGVIVPLDKELPINEIENLIKRSKADAIIYSGKYEENIMQIADKLPNLKNFINMDNGSGEPMSNFWNLIQRGIELIGQGDERFIHAVINEDEMNMLLFTSGTTDLAKGVMLSHKNICTNLMNMCSMLYIDEKDIFLSILPIHHAYECTCGFLCAIYRGCTIAYCEGLRHIARNLKEARATMMLGVPLLFEAMYKKIWQQAEKEGMASKLRFGIRLNNMLNIFGIDISKKLFKKIHDSFGGNLRMLVNGAAAIDPNVSKGFRDLGILVMQGYGLTECSPIVALNRDCYFRDDAAGCPLPNMDVKINNTGDDNVGEIICRGENVMKGYYENEEETNKVIKEGWFYTGDLGYIDKGGFIHITGRKKNVIVTKNGKNIFPEEVEAYLNRSDYIAESLVWGKYNEENDETYVNAQILPEYEAVEKTLGVNYTQEQFKQLINNEIKQVNKKMTLYKRVSHFTIREEDFAKTTTQKIKRHIENPQEN